MVDNSLVQHVIKGYEESEGKKVYPIRQERRLGNWLKAYLDLTVGHEAPEMFHLWCGLTTLAASVRRNVYLHEAFFTTYPNILVILVATSGELAKSTCVDWAAEFVKDNDYVHKLHDMATPEGLIARLASQIDRDEMARTRRVKMDASMYIIASELSTFFSQATYMSGMMSTITRLADSPPDYNFGTKHSPIALDNICINMIGASTPEWLAKGLPDPVKSGGSLGRFIFVVQHKPKGRIPFPKKSREHDKIKKALVDDLVVLSRLKGQFSWNEKTMEMYDHWYNNEWKISPDVRIGEYTKRKRGTVKKLAMLFSLSESSNLVLMPHHLQAAFTLLEAIEKDMLDAFIFLGSTAESQLGHMILSLLQNSGPVSRMSLMQWTAHRFRRADELDNVLEILQQQGYITKGHKGDVPYWRLTTQEEKRREAEDRRRLRGVGRRLFDENGDLL